MPALSIGDAELYYESRGEGPPVLLVPGLGGIGTFWAKLVADLPETPEFTRLLTRTWTRFRTGK